MRKAKVLLLVAITVGAVTTILLQHEQNRQLVQELTAVREENSRLTSLQPAPNSDKTENRTQPKAVEELQSELVRLRGLASKAGRQETEITQLKAELEQLRTRTPNGAGTPSSDPDTLSAYLGSAVETPPNLDPAYSKDGLLGAIQVAAQKAGVSLKKVSVDDSEFPFLIGVVSEPGDWEKLKAQLRNTDGYEYHGAVGNDTSNTFFHCSIASIPSGQQRPNQSANQRTNAAFLRHL